METTATLSPEGREVNPSGGNEGPLFYCLLKGPCSTTRWSSAGDGSQPKEAKDGNLCTYPYSSICNKPQWLMPTLSPCITSLSTIITHLFLKFRLIDLLTQRRLVVKWRTSSRFVTQIFGVNSWTHLCIKKRYAFSSMSTTTHREPLPCLVEYVSLWRRTSVKSPLMSPSINTISKSLASTYSIAII